MNHRQIASIARLLLLAPLAGCAHYYRVQDPIGGKTYYTDSVDKKDSGAISFRDLQTGADMTIQNSGVKEISKSELPAELAK